MKKVIKSKLFYFLLGAILFSGITVYATAQILASSIVYTPKDANWNVNNVKDAIDNLYDIANRKTGIVYLSETTVRSSDSHSFDVSNIEGYETFTKDNFIYKFVTFEWVGSSVENSGLEIEYDNNSGIVVFPKQIGGSYGKQLGIIYYPVLVY